MAMKTVPDDFGGEKYKFETQGQTLEGHFQGSSKFTHNGKEITKHSFLLRDGTLVGTLGSKDLTRQLAKVPVGAFSRVTYVTQKKIPGQPQPLKVFKTQYDEEDVVIQAETDTPSPSKTGHTPSSIKQQKVLS